MARVLPSSLTPHICILPSQDLEELLQSSVLPSLHHILQSFSPLPQVTTRTTTLTTVPHASFALRFSDLTEIESACREDEEQRATRTIDWIGDRISKRCAKWVDDFEKMNDRDVARTPWWDELRRCAEGDHIPARDEGWNHPMSIILAVSTTAPNPLQAITALHSRTLDFPSWVDVTHLIYTLIIHPKNSPLSDEEAGALFNAVKKQYGLHTYLLSLELPSPPPPPVSIPALVPRLPPPTISNGSADAVRPELKTTQTVPLNTLRMSEQDIQQTARFAREFVTMNLVPWMEKYVIEWNETVSINKFPSKYLTESLHQYSSSRRLPSRLFSSTRRLFGTSSATPVHSSTPLHTRSSTYTAPQSPLSGSTIPPPSQQRRLAEFATILGDFKLAVAVWESLRKEGKGGSDILPLLISPSPAVQLHVSHALNIIYPQSAELHSHAQLRALLYAVRWESTLTIGDFLSDTLEGERWLVWAAGNAEEPPAALLLAHAALLSVRKNAKRRAALWYFFAANRLEKCGIKPLTMYFLRRAHELSLSRPEKLLSPSFWMSENKQPSDFEGFDAVMSGIEHPLGRLLYTTGDVPGAHHPSPLAQLSSHTVDITTDPSNSDKVFLEDFQVAISHLKSISGEQARLEDVKLPLRFVVPSQTCVRLARDSVEGEQSEWETREEIWSSFWKHRGKEKLERSGNAAVEEAFWVDITLCNPLDTEVTLANPTVIVESSSETLPGFEITSQLRLLRILSSLPTNRAQLVVPISIAIKASKPASLVITGVAYDFLGLLPTVESLARRDRQSHTRPDELLKLDVEEASQELAVAFVDDGPLVLAEGECKWMKLLISNAGSRDIGEVWVVPGAEDQIWIEPLGSGEGAHAELGSATGMAWKTWQSDNKIVPPTPYSIPLTEKLVTSGSTEVTVVLHAGCKRKQDLSLLFIYREAQGSPFHCTRVTRSYEVVQCLQISTASHPSHSLDHSFSLSLDLTNILSSSNVEINQVTTISASWSCSPLAELRPEPLRPSQSARISFGATSTGDCTSVNAVSAFVSRKLSNVLHGQVLAPDDPPPLELLCGHVSQRIAVSRSLAQSHPRIPTSSHPSIFPLYNPLSVDFVVFWKIPSEQRSGHILVSDITLGASHAALRGVLEGVESAKVKRSMYAETQREKVEMLQAIRDSEWNAEMNPIVVIVKDGLVIEHDFSQGVCLTHVEFTIRNHSLSHPSRFVLRLDHCQQSSSVLSTDSVCRHHLPAPYCGRTTFRGLLEPLQTTSVLAQLCATCPGTYALSGWRLETEVGEPGTEDGLWQVRHRYEQRAAADNSSSIVISDLS
ncbi:ER-golgi trafficking TRAPP I complex 85 kDa subunit-domain-containing protein [Suillus subalutaceus]|uniref:ER-golgi trafficking TRAPP I complex 85 kDa subunit-domain-containing protein n=1 Tax=Suillus subalutaceus TaxID=48586 RepID=UPI001B85D4C1|nr:ER-golgi trafficking TRAPP I complex 85 kDa subunit-domain-containing protein [Suillus subalutaceus]KAG1875607.1 ER-golgi trafficking TRAPP I complex 85 kDa subunit-domain-containing protein [Suillus subalutaceus]